MNDALHMLIGASLVVLGVIAAAVADRIRGLRVQRPARAAAVPAEVDSREQPTERVTTRRASSPVLAEPPAPSVEIARQKQLAADVIVALVSAGYKKSQAGEATWGCGLADRATLESWTRAALRRAAGGVS